MSLRLVAPPQMKNRPTTSHTSERVLDAGAGAVICVAAMTMISLSYAHVFTRGWSVTIGRAA